MQFDTVIGLEIHIQLATRSKLFSSASTDFGALANQNTSIIDLALPGVLPVLNQAVVDMSIKLGLALNAQINNKSIFDRKNYFYPDLPKGYQISQFYHPIVGKGYLDIPLADGTTKRVTVERAHLEEDAGKSLHADFDNMTGIDLNRAGVPLLEIVSAPEIYSAAEAVSYLKTIHSLIRYLEISDGNMSQGSMRCDANVSVKSKGSDVLGTRAEIKNVNSFKFVEKAINYEVDRQISVITAGGTVVQETRLYDSVKNETRSMRSKEEANDYRYFPDPDLLPVIITDADIAAVKSTMPELPQAKKQRFIQELSISADDASILVANKELANYFEAIVANKVEAKLAVNWVLGELSGALNKNNLDIEASPVTPEQLSALLHKIMDNTLSGKMAKQVFEYLWQGQGSVEEIIHKYNLSQITDVAAIDAIIDEIINNNHEQVEQYRQADANKQGRLLGFFVGQVMKASKGSADPSQVNKRLVEKL